MEAKQGPAQWRCCYASKYQSGGDTNSDDGYEGDGGGVGGDDGEGDGGGVSGDGYEGDGSGDGGEGDGGGVGVVVGMRRRNAVYLTSHLIIR